MNGGLIAKRYGTALEQYSAERGQQEECFRDSRTMLAELRPIEEVLSSPVASAKKLELLRTAVPGRCDAFDDFLQLIVKQEHTGADTVEIEVTTDPAIIGGFIY